MQQITRQQDTFIAALLTGKTVSEATASVGVNKATGYRWLQDSNVLGELNRRRAAVRGAALDKLLSECRNAADVIVSIANDTNVKADVRLRAAEAILDRVTGQAEIDALRTELDLLRDQIAVNHDLRNTRWGR